MILYIAVDISAGFLNWLDEFGIQTDELEILGLDGTAVNTGHLGGCIHLLERKLKRRLQWSVCMFHHAELPLRHLFILLDGATSGKSPIYQSKLHLNNKQIRNYHSQN